LTKASALVLSPVPLALLCTVKVSPVAGVPEILVCHPLSVMLPPDVYAKLRLR